MHAERCAHDAGFMPFCIGRAFQLSTTRTASNQSAVSSTLQIAGTGQRDILMSSESPRSSLVRCRPSKDAQFGTRLSEDTCAMNDERR